jgi:hypothetical protein
MNSDSSPARTVVRLAPDVVFTRLPFGGAVLVNAVTLALAECGDRDADIIDGLLVHGIPESDAGAVVRHMVEQMIKTGWLEAGPRTDRRS